MNSKINTKNDTKIICDACVNFPTGSKLYEIKTNQPGKCKWCNRCRNTWLRLWRKTYQETDKIISSKLDEIGSIPSQGDYSDEVVAQILVNLRVIKKRCNCQCKLELRPLITPNDSEYRCNFCILCIILFQTTSLPSIRGFGLSKYGFLIPEVEENILKLIRTDVPTIRLQPILNKNITDCERMTDSSVSQSNSGSSQIFSPSPSSLSNKSSPRDPHNLIVQTTDAVFSPMSHQSKRSSDTQNFEDIYNFRTGKRDKNETNVCAALNSQFKLYNQPDILRFKDIQTLSVIYYLHKSFMTHITKDLYQNRGFILDKQILALEEPSLSNALPTKEPNLSPKINNILKQGIEIPHKDIGQSEAFKRSSLNPINILNASNVVTSCKKSIFDNWKLTVNSCRQLSKSIVRQSNFQDVVSKNNVPNFVYECDYLFSRWRPELARISNSPKVTSSADTMITLTKYRWFTQLTWAMIHEVYFGGHQLDAPDNKVQDTIVHYEILKLLMFIKDKNNDARGDSIDLDANFSDLLNKHKHGDKSKESDTAHYTVITPELFSTLLTAHPFTEVKLGTSTPLEIFYHESFRKISSTVKKYWIFTIMCNYSSDADVYFMTKKLYFSRNQINDHILSHVEKEDDKFTNQQLIDKLHSLSKKLHDTPGFLFCITVLAVFHDIRTECMGHLENHKNFIIERKKMKAKSDYERDLHQVLTSRAQATAAGKLVSSIQDFKLPSGPDFYQGEKEVSLMMDRLRGFRDNIYKLIIGRYKHKYIGDCGEIMMFLEEAVDRNLFYVHPEFMDRIPHFSSNVVMQLIL